MDTVIYTHEPGRAPRVIDVAFTTEDGRTVGRYSGKTPAELSEAYSGAAMLTATMEAYQKAHDDALRTDPEEITREAYIDALEVLPPVRFTQSEGVESFRMSERWSGAMTSIYACLRGRYWRFVDRIDLPTTELNRKVAAAARAS